MSQKPRSSSRDSVGSDVTAADLREYMKKQNQIRVDKKRQAALEKKKEIEERKRKLDALRKVTREVAQKAGKRKISRVQTNEGTKAQPIKVLPIAEPMKPKSPKKVAVDKIKIFPNKDNIKQQPEVTKIKVFVKDNEPRQPNYEPKGFAINSILYNSPWPVFPEQEKKAMEMTTIVSKSLSTVIQPVESSVHPSIPEVVSTLTKKSSELMDHDISTVTSKQNSSIKENIETTSPVDQQTVSDQYPLSTTTTWMEMFANQKKMSSLDKYDTPSIISDVGRSKNSIPQSPSFYFEHLSPIPSVMSEITSKLSTEEPTNNFQGPIVLGPILDQTASKHSIAISAQQFPDLKASKNSIAVSAQQFLDHKVSKNSIALSALNFLDHKVSKHSIALSAPQFADHKASKHSIAVSAPQFSEEPVPEPNNFQSPIVLEPIANREVSKHSIALSAPQFSDTAVLERKYSEQLVPETNNFQSPIVLEPISNHEASKEHSLAVSAPHFLDNSEQSVSKPKPFLGNSGTAESSSVFEISIAIMSTPTQKTSSFKQSSVDATGSVEPVLMSKSSGMTNKSFSSVTTQTESIYRGTPIAPTVNQFREQKPTTHSFGYNYTDTCDDWKPNDDLDEFCEQSLFNSKKKSNQCVSPSTSSSSLSMNSVPEINVPPPRQPSIKPKVVVSHESIDRAIIELNIRMMEYLIQSEKIEMEQNRVTLCLKQRTLYNRLNFTTAMRDLHVSVMKHRPGHEMRMQKYSDSVHRINSAIDDVKELCRSIGSVYNKRIVKLEGALRDFKQ